MTEHSSTLGHQSSLVDINIGVLSVAEKTNSALRKLAAIRPNVLLLEELTFNLDPNTREEILRPTSNFKGSIVLPNHVVGGNSALNTQITPTYASGDEENWIVGDERITA